MPSNEPTSAADTLRRELDARFHGPLMNFFLRRVGRKDEAEDLTQEVFLRAIGSAQLERLEHAQAFIFRIAINLLRDRKRREVRSGMPVFVPLEDALADELENRLVEDLSPERVLIGKNSLNDVLQSLDELGPRTRDIFILFRLEGMRQKEIAAFYGIGQSTVEKHVMKAFLHLAARYGGDGLDE